MQISALEHSDCKKGIASITPRFVSNIVLRACTTYHPLF